VLEVAAALDDGVNAKRAPAVRRLLVAAADRADPAVERILIKLLRDGGLDGWPAASGSAPTRSTSGSRR
jgi:hypothetical protein